MGNKSLQIYVNGEEKGIISASEVYEPFEDIRYWLDKRLGVRNSIPA